MLCPACGTPSEGIAESCFGCGRSLYTLTKGEVLSERYEILSLLGKGGMGMVYKAHDRELDEVVAIKILRPDFAQSAEMTKRFRSEIKLARKVRHKNVCGIHEYGQDRHLRYIAMEFVDGVDLKSLLKSEGPLPPEQAFDAAIQVAGGLHAVHDVGIVHRDLKTPNIMRDTRGIIRLMDFGIAKSFDSDGTTGATLTGQIIGTPEYMSPEQVRGERIDARSDVYALGIVAYELFTGSVPFHGDTPAATLLKHLNEAFTLEGAPSAKLPAAVVPVLRRALAKDRDERYASAEEMAEALRAARRETSVDPVRAFATPPTIVWSPPTIDTAVDNDTPDEDIEFVPMKTAPPPPARPATPVQLPRPPMPVEPSRPVVPERVAGSVVPAQRPATRPAMSLPTMIVPPAKRNRRGLFVGMAIAPLLIGVGVVAYYITAPDPEPTPTPTPEVAVPGPQAKSAPAPVVSDQGPSEPPPTTVPTRTTLAPAFLQKVFGTKASVPPPATTAEAEPTRPIEPPQTQPAPVPPSMAPATVPAAPTVTTQPPLQVEPAAPPPTAPATPGSLRVKVVPWAEVFVDGRPSGKVSSVEVRLAPGRHVVVFRHPGFEPLRRVVMVRSGDTADLTVDLRDEGIKRK